MNTLLQIIGISWAANLFVSHIGYKYKKPFSCELCMAFWIGLFYFHSVEGLFFAFTSSVIAVLINRYV